MIQKFILFSDSSCPFKQSFTKLKFKTMKKLISLFTTVFFLCICINSFAQVNTYSFSQFGGTYTEITGGTIVATATGTSGVPSIDDVIFPAQAIPFSFTFNGTAYTSYTLSSNGFITFGATLPTTTTYGPISAVLAYDGAVSVTGRDIQGCFATTANRAIGSTTLSNVLNFRGVVVGRIITGTGIPAGTTVTGFNTALNEIYISAAATSTGTGGTVTIAAGELRSETLGPLGSQVHVIQWKNFRKFGGATDNFNMQIRLYEGSNVIECVYGSDTSNTTNASPQVGLRGLTNADFNNRTGTIWSASTAGALNNSTMTLNATSLPVSGQVYQWTPPLPPVADDMGVTNSNLLNGRIYTAGKGYDFIATVKNFGTNTQNVVPVYYNVDDGPAIGPVNTVGPIPTNGTEDVTFSGGFALNVATSGVHVIKIFTDLSGDQDLLNDTLEVNVLFYDKITSYPYLQTFGFPYGWTVLTENPGPSGSTPLWILGLCTNPAGVAGDTAARCNFYGPSNNAGRKEVLRSPEFDISSLTNPVVHFYVSYRTFIAEDDSMEVLVSTDAGLTFFSASTVYNKSNSSVPSLATRPNQSPLFVPDSSIQWRHETVSLANVAGSSNVIIGFRGKSAYGNNAWVDNVIVTDVSSLCTDAVTAPGIYSCNALVDLNFNTVGRPVSGNNGYVTETAVKSFEKEEVFGVFESSETNEKLTFHSATETDNPTGGDAMVSQHTNSTPPSVASQIIATNSTATTNDGSIFTPLIVYSHFWFTVTYTGNDKAGYALYDISIDLDGLLLPNPDRVYIVKRADMTDSWQCQNTTRSGSILTVSGLNIFCDFALAGNDAPLPVELASFTSVINGRDVTLNWSTSSEVNNSGFDIERSVINGTWTKIGNVEGHGTTNSANSYSFADRGLNSGVYNYRLKQIDFNGNFEYFNLSNEVNIGIPEKYNMSQNYPNPFNPSTTISFDLPFDSKVSLKLFDMTGREVASLVSEFKTAGYHTVNYNASNLSSGVYFYRITAEANGKNFVDTKKMMLVK